MVCRCNDPVQRVEQAALGTVFICTHGGTKHGVSGCRRTYLSNRDLQAHIQYRHMRGAGGDEAARAGSGASSSRAAAPQVQAPAAGGAPAGYVTSQAPGQQVINVTVQPGQAPVYSVSAPPGLPAPFSSGPGGQVFSQPPPAPEGYHTSVIQHAPGGHPISMVTVPIQAAAAYDSSVPPPGLAPPPQVANVNFPPPPAGGAVQGRPFVPAVSFSSSIPPPALQLTALPRGAVVTSSHVAPPGLGPPGPAPHQGLPPPPHASGPPPPHGSGPPPPHRGGAPPRFAHGQNYPPGHWQGQGRNNVGHRSRTGSGPPPRY